MSSVITAVFKATIGLIVNKGRDATAERLKDGDVADQKFRDVIVREMEDIKTKLDGLARKDLLSGIDAFETGLGHLYQAIDEEAGEATTRAAGTFVEKHLKEISSPSPTAVAKTVALAAEMNDMKLKEFSDKTKRALYQAKERFKMARQGATRAFNNEALSTFTRVTAIRYRVMATMLGSAIETVATTGDLSTLSVENVLENALPECEQCLQKLNSLPDVQNNFKVELEKGPLNIKDRFGKDKRRQIISTVCQINRAIYDAKNTVNKDQQIWIWPLIDTGEDKVDPLRDRRVAKVLETVGTKHSCLTPLSFGQEGQRENKLRTPWAGIATNSDGQFIVADDLDKNIKVFDSNGNFLLSFNTCGIDDAREHITILDLATDENNNIYVLMGSKKTPELEVKVFKSTDELLLKFPTGSDSEYYIARIELLLKFPAGSDDSKYYIARMAVTSNKVLVLRNTENRHVIDVYDHDGAFVRQLDEKTIRFATHFTADNDGRIMIVNRIDSYIHVFTDDGEQLSKFHINIDQKYFPRGIGCHLKGEHVVGGGIESTGLCGASIYTKDGKFVREITCHEYQIRKFWGITVTRKGHIAVVVNERIGIGRVIVFD